MPNFYDAQGNRWGANGGRARRAKPTPPNQPVPDQPSIADFSNWANTKAAQDASREAVAKYLRGQIGAQANSLAKFDRKRFGTEAESFKRLASSDSTDLKLLFGERERLRKYGEAAPKLKQPKGLKRGLLRLLSAGAGGAGAGIEQVTMQPYYASKQAQISGSGALDQARTFGSGLPGLGALASKKGRKAIEATNSQGERQRLTAQHRLASFGEQVTGRAQHQLTGLSAQERARLHLPGSGQLPDAASGLVDVGLQTFGDPLNLAISGAGAFAKIGEGLSRARRAEILLNPTGKGLIDAATRAAVENGDIKALQKAIPDLQSAIAVKVLAAADEGGEQAARQVLQRAFIDGTWNPTVRLRNQALMRLGLSENPGVKAVRNGGLADIRGGIGRVVQNLARGDMPQALVFGSKNVDRVLKSATEAALARLKVSPLDYFREVVAPSIEHLTPIRRVQQLIHDAERHGQPAFSELVSELKGEALRNGTDGMTSPDFIRRIDQLELTSSLLAHSDSAVAEQVRVSLAKGLNADELSADALLKKANSNVGKVVKAGIGKAPDSSVKLPTDPEALAITMRARISTKTESNELRSKLLAGLDEAAAAGDGKLARYAVHVDEALSNPKVLAEAERIVASQAARAAEALPDATAPNALRRALGEGLLSTAESTAKRAVPFEIGPNASRNVAMRVEAVDRLMTGYQLPGFVRSEYRKRVGELTTEEGLIGVRHDLIQQVAHTHGVDPAELGKVLELNVAAINQRARFAVEVLAHRAEDVVFPDPTDVMRTVTDLLARDGNRGAQLRAGIGKVARFPFQGPRAAQITVGAVGGALVSGDSPTDRLKGAAIGAAAGAVGFERVHTLWKMSVVTNTPAIAAGVVAGSMGAFGNDHNPLKGALIGGTLGLLAPTRYIARIGIEEKMRTYMSAGFKPVEFVPFASKWARRRGLEDLPFMSTDLIRSGGTIGPHLSHRLITTLGDEFVEIPVKGAHGIDAWWRIVNYQAHVETDVLAEIMVRERAGLITKAKADAAAADFLATDDGELVLRRLKAGLDGPKNAVEAITSYRRFVEKHMTPEIAAARLDGEVERDLLREIRKAGGAPEMVSAQQTWVLPKSAKQLFTTAEQLTSKLVLSGPTSKFTREPLAEHVYSREVGRLLGEGVEPKLAQELADDFAVRKTNEVMVQISDESRFAKKVDFLLPFQQPREELLRVWLPLIANNKAKTLKAFRLGATALNNGAASGMFRRDEFSGDYTMTIPGSPWLSDLLFNTSARFDVTLKDMLFVGQGAYNVGFLPSPGGPFWGTAVKSYIDHHPEAYADFEKRFPALHSLVFPYGANGKILRNEPNRLWMAFTGSTPPWEFVAGEGQEQELTKWTREVALQLRAEHFKETGEADWWPSENDVRDATSHFFQAWSFFGSVFPASSRPVLPGRSEADALRAMYKSKDGVFDYFRAIKDNPAFEPFFSATKEYVGPNDFKSWTEVEEERADIRLGDFRQRTWQELKAQVAEARKKAIAFDERREIIATPDRLERERQLLAWRQKYPQYKDLSRSNYLRDTELHDILTTYPKRLQDEALDQWRRHYEVDARSYKYVREHVLREYKSNPWASARDPEDIAAAIKRATQGGAVDEDYAVSLLSPAEQVRYWQYKRSEVDYYQGSEDPRAVLDRFNIYKQRERAVYATYPELRKSSKELTPLEKAIELWQGDAYQQISAGYAEGARLKEAMNAAAQAKRWSVYFSLKARRDAVYAQVDAIKRQQFKGYPALKAHMEDFRALYVKVGDTVSADEWEAFQQTLSEKVGFRFVQSSEDQAYLKMPQPVRQAFIDDLLNRLDQADHTKGKLFWEWLTDFQRTVLENNLPANAVESFKRAHPSKGGSGHRKSTGIAGLDYAYSLFDQYNKRPKGQKAPASYAAYLKLPDNPIVRADFLKKHPDAAAWIKLGPMANMPEMLRYLVSNIMIQNGKWGGELKTFQEITDLSFAREQLKRWSRRGDAAAPANYDTWVNMPTGVAKAQYLKAHPEIQNWIKLGPMVNMPEEYQDVVRDIMQRYGEWTEKQDPLGKTISDFYATPTYARDAFLKDHPELLEYWSATRSDAENQMFALSDRYFSMQDQAGRKMFLASHPELQQWFVDQRTKRYEKFLNQVAQYMGQNPELFKHYLDRQNDILAELLRQYASSPMVREVAYLSDANAKASSTSEGGRKRNKAA